MQVEKFALHEFAHSARNCSCTSASCTSFLHFYLSNFEGDQPISFMHGLTRQNWCQMPVKTIKIATNEISSIIGTLTCQLG